MDVDQGEGVIFFGADFGPGFGEEVGPATCSGVVFAHTFDVAQVNCFFEVLEVGFDNFDGVA